MSLRRSPLGWLALPTTLLLALPPTLHALPPALPPALPLQSATATLERTEAALLHDPANLALLLEYAIALAASGDVASAQQVLLQLRNNPDLSPALRQQIAELLAHSPAAPTPTPAPTQSPTPTPTPQPQGSLSLSLGHDDNLLGAAQQGPFHLTLPGATLLVQPGAEQQPRRGFYAGADLRLHGSLQPGGPPLAQPPLRYALFLGLRASPGQPAGRSHWGALIEASPSPASPPPWPAAYVQLAHQQLHVNHASVYRQTLLGAGLHASPPAWACHTRLGAELQWRHYPQATQLDGHYSGLQSHTHCPQMALHNAWPMPLHITLRAGQDRPRHASRPGGAQQHAGIRLGTQASLGRGQLQAQAEWAWQRDASGYSPLLHHNRSRSLQRASYRLQYQWQAPWPATGPAQRWQPTVSLEWLHQRANLPLFGLRNRVLTVGVQTQW